MSDVHRTGGVEVGIVTGDVAGLGRFLVEGLGFVADEVRRFPQGEVHRFHRGAGRCKVFAPVDAPGAGPDVGAWPSRTGFAYAALLVDDADAALARATEAGATTVTDLVSHRPGARMAMIRDPQGNIWELLEERT